MSIEYPSSEVTFEVTELPLLRELCVRETLNCSMCPYTYNVAIVNSGPLAWRS